MKAKLKEWARDPYFLVIVALILILLYVTGGVALVDLFDGWTNEPATTQGV
jgi:uncharacterized protein YpuA (DUF1002 family)